MESNRELWPESKAIKIVGQDLCLLVCYVVQIDKYLPTFQNIVDVSFLGSRNPKYFMQITANLDLEKLLTL
jgi:hypothetical protein